MKKNEDHHLITGQCGQWVSKRECLLCWCMRQKDGMRNEGCRRESGQSLCNGGREKEEGAVGDLLPSWG